MGAGKPRSVLPRSLRAAAVLTVGMIALLWTFNQEQPAPAPAQPRARPKTKVGWVGHIFDQRPPSGLTFKEAQPICSDNSGNLIWAYGAWKLVDPNATELIPLVAPPFMQRISALLLPTANMLMNASKYGAVQQYTQQVLGIAQQVEAPILLIGVGSQVRFDEAPSAGGGGAGAAQPGSANFSAAGSVALHPDQTAFLQRVHDSAGLVVTRGRFTAAIVEGNGLPPPLPLGCPSLFIDHSLRLGAALQRKWDAVLEQRSSKLRLAVTLPKIHKDRPFPAPLVKLLAERVLKAFPNSVVVLQTLDDALTIKAMHDKHGLYLMPDRVRYFYDVDSWVDGLKACCDFVFGFRIHGTMAGVAAGVPGIVISRDFRIKELAEAMAIPTVDSLQANLDLATFDLFDLLEGAGFDGRRFDARRREVARVYAREFKRLKVPLHPGIAHLAKHS